MIYIRCRKIINIVAILFTRHAGLLHHEQVIIPSSFYERLRKGFLSVSDEARQKTLCY